MKGIMRKLATIAVVALVLAGCQRDATIVSENLSLAADQFEIDRRVVVFNGITDSYLLSVEGRCSIEDEGNQLEITCKDGPNSYKKHFAGLSDNVSYFVEQLEAADASEFRYRVIFKPESIVPAVDLETSSSDQ